MTTPYFSKPADLAPVTKARSVDINNLSALITAAFSKVPDELVLKSGTANYAVDSGAGNAYVATLDTKVAAYADGLEVKLRVMRANTGAATLSVNGMGAIAIKRVNGTDAQAGDIPAGSTLALVYSAAMNAFCLPAVVVGTLNAAIAAAAQSVQDAAAQVQLAAGQAAAAATSAGQSSGYATNSQTSAQASATSAAASEASRIAADKRFLGNKAVAPTVDNQGAALQSGAAYYDTALGKIQVWNGAAWTAGIATVAGVSSLNGNTGALTLKTVNGVALDGVGDIVPTAIQRFARVANTQLVAADKSKWLSLSGTFTQTFDTVANLGQGWFAYVSNKGTGKITIPSSDGATNWVMYPGETRLFVCDGAALNSIVMETFTATFTSTSGFIRPPGYNWFDLELWGAGGGGCGAGYNGTAGGGSGGGYFRKLFPAADLGAAGSSNTVSIGGGGTGGNGSSSSSTRVPGTNGGASSFLGLYAAGGSSGTATGSAASPVSGGAGGGISSDPYVGAPTNILPSAAGIGVLLAGSSGGNGGDAVINSPGGAGGLRIGSLGPIAVGAAGAAGAAGPMFGGGAGGATAANNSSSGFAGGDGGIASGGGGGGCATASGAGSYFGGKGGNGGSGYAIIRGVL